MTLVRIGSITAGVVCALLAALASTAGAVNGPNLQSFEPANLGIAFQLPSEWAGGPGHGKTSKFFAVAPGQVAELEILAGPTKLSADAFAGAFVSGEEQVVRSGDSRATFVHHRIVVGAATLATETVATYRGFGDVSQRPGEKLVVVAYGFVHGGRAYILQFTTTDTWLPKLRGTFRASARSVRFPYVT